MKRWMYTALLILFSGIFLVSAFYLGSYFWESHKQQSKYKDLASIVHGAQGYWTQPTTPQQTPDDTQPPVTEPPLVQVENPDTGEFIWVLPEYAPIYAMNPDLVGWIRIADTKVDYPVVQKPDVEDYYLHRNFDRQSSAQGCLYAREVCDVSAPSDNITIYGHRMRDGSMFGQLDRFLKQDFWQEHPTFTFDTLSEHHTYEILSVFITSATPGKGFTYHLFVDATDENAFNQFVSTCKSLELYDTGVDAVYGDKLICLSTCEYTRENGRLVVVAKRIERPAD